MRALWIVVAMLLLACSVGAQPVGTPGQPRPIPTWMPVQPVRPEVYGPDLHEDATGRPFRWRTEEGLRPLGPVQPDVFGPGVGMDATGRPVHAEPWTGGGD